MTTMNSETISMLRDGLTKIERRSTRVSDDDHWEDCWTHDATYHFDDGRVVNLEANGAEGIVIPSAAGFEVLRFRPKPDDDPDSSDIIAAIERVPIIGWSVIDAFGLEVVAPITIDGIIQDDGDSFTAIVGPDGRVYSDDRRRGTPPLDHIDAWANTLCVKCLAHRKMEKAAASKRRPTCSRPHDETVEATDPIPPI